ncbi:bifunctional helix-turn-helix transcriptional regulator/GNAT family N-acetyltransferase [Chitinophaga solisilvae]|uniref:GNAT family N-acetyltransferase n=1 Tax=Chitinophaga solisilvae TaxID=1233460 RepID=A0A3S1AYG6_9BACT|nr:GNAT family N-acetyltransferase [Chitinophaga solisilvae]NSL87856.1 GNAT family N-acetyltransferase [Chitinophaga solisilvae]
MSFFDTAGKMAIGSRLRLLTEKITEDAGKIYALFGVGLQPKWFPVFYMLANNEALTITAIAKEIGHSHVSVSKIVREMVKHGLVKEKKDKSDGRRNMVTLSAAGREVNQRLSEQCVDVGSAIEELSASATHNLWEAIGEWEFLLEQRSLLRRVMDQKKKREGQEVTIVPYSRKYQQAFRDLNEEWISTYFKMEAADYKALDNPKSHILDKGGIILVALYKEEPVGVCALIKMKDPDYDYELAKMAVSPRMQGKSIGWLLGSAIVEQARALGARNIYLESNTMLKPAISLYHKLGFQKVAGRATPYERCNIQMELIF